MADRGPEFIAALRHMMQAMADAREAVPVGSEWWLGEGAVFRVLAHAATWQPETQRFNVPIVAVLGCGPAVMVIPIDELVSPWRNAPQEVSRADQA